MRVLGIKSLGQWAEIECTDDEELLYPYFVVNGQGNQLNKIGPKLQIIQKMEDGRRVTGFDAEEMTRGSLHIDQDIKRGENIKGGKFGHIG
jgi:hypothetical protein